MCENYLKKQLYLKPYIDKINKEHQITHVCVPKMVSSEYITDTFIVNIKTLYGLNITVVQFDPILFKRIHEDWTDEDYTTDDLTDGLYILIDTMNEFNLMKYIRIIQRKINIAIDDYKKINNIEKTDNDGCWTLHYLSNKRHKWVRKK